MESEGTGVRIMEILPPSVQTELHDKEVQPDIENGRQLGMGITEFVNELWEDLNGGQGAVGADRDEFPVGEGKKRYVIPIGGRGLWARGMEGHDANSCHRYEVIEKARRSQMVGVPMTPAKMPQ